jgi:hypothetical protein
MSLNVGQVLVVLALITFGIAALGWTYRRIDLVAIGLALWSLASLVSRVPLVFQHFVGPLGTVILILAFLSFVAAAVGWRYRKVNLIAAGLALWTLSAIVP